MPECGLFQYIISISNFVSEPVFATANYVSIVDKRFFTWVIEWYTKNRMTANGVKHIMKRRAISKDLPINNGLGIRYKIHLYSNSNSAINNSNIKNANDKCNILIQIIKTVARLLLTIRWKIWLMLVSFSTLVIYNNCQVLK